MTAARLRPGDPGYLEAIPPFDMGLPPTAPDGTVAVRPTALVSVAVAVAVADHEAQGHVGRLLAAIAAERFAGPVT